jgi:hypothetical protein
MTVKDSLGLAATLFLSALLVPPLAQAQQRTAATMAPRSNSLRVKPAPMGMGAHRASGNRTSDVAIRPTYFDPSSNGFVYPGGGFVPLQDILYTVPGLGFDYSHLAVLNANMSEKAFIDPLTEWRLTRAEHSRNGHSSHPRNTPGYFLFDTGGYSYPADDDSTPSDQSAPQPQIIVVQAPQAPQSSESQPAPDSTEQAEPPLADVGTFTLVLQNGKQIEAFAFTRSNDRVVYITTAGTRQSIAAADLNFEETVRINQERGTPLELPL